MAAANYHQIQPLASICTDGVGRRSESTRKMRPPAQAAVALVVSPVRSPISPTVSLAAVRPRTGAAACIPAPRTALCAPRRHCCSRTTRTHVQRQGLPATTRGLGPRTAKPSAFRGCAGGLLERLGTRRVRALRLWPLRVAPHWGSVRVRVLCQSMLLGSRDYCNQQPLVATPEPQIVMGNRSWRVTGDAGAADAHVGP